MAGEIVHLEFPSSDFARSATFYSKLFGWKTDGAQSGGHLLFELPGGVQGSWIRSALAQATGPVPFVAVADVDKALAEAERHGGRVLVKRMTLASRGDFGLLADCDGNVIGVLATKGGAPAAAGGGARDVAETSAPTVKDAAAPVPSKGEGKAKAPSKASEKSPAKAAGEKSPAKKATPRKR